MSNTSVSTNDVADIAVIAPVPRPAAIPEDDLELIALLDRSVPVTRVVELYDQVDQFITDIEVRVQSELELARQRRNAIKAIVAARMDDQKKSILAMRGFDQIEFVTETETEKRVEVLKELLTLKNEDGDPLIPEDVLKKAIWPEPPKPVEPVIKTHLTFLRKLAPYGEAVQDILKRGIIETQGPRVLVIRRTPLEQKNVTPAAVTA